MDAMFDDLLGEPVRRGPGRPRKSDVEPFVGNFAANVDHGISVKMLAAYFRMSRKAVVQALTPCLPLRTGRDGGLLYDFVEAASYLVPPRRDMREYLKTITDKDLPQELREAFWNAKIKEMKARTMAGDLWPSASVLEVLGETFKTIKNTMQLWTDTIDESKGLTEEQRQLLTTLVDKLMSEIYESMVAQAKSTSTESFARALDDD